MVLLSMEVEEVELHFFEGVEVELLLEVVMKGDQEQALH